MSAHRMNCVCQDANIKDFDITFMEHYLGRGKYSLSERELVWNKRVQGSITENIEAFMRITFCLYVLFISQLFNLFHNYIF